MLLPPDQCRNLRARRDQSAAGLHVGGRRGDQNGCRGIYQRNRDRRSGIPDAPVPPANLNGSADSATFDITDLQIGTSPGSLAPANVVIGFNAVAACAPANVEVVVIP